MALLMTKVFIIRHAETEPTGEDAFYWPLSERGEEQARLLGGQSFWDEVKAIVTSDEPKAIATVSRIAFERQIPMFTNPNLRELKRTPGWLEDYEARVLEVLQKPALSIGGWERAADAQARMVACFDELVKKFDPRPFVIVSHGMAISLLLASLQNMMGYVFDIWQNLSFAEVILVERDTG